jgi:DNA polymerase-3 subunit delta
MYHVLTDKSQRNVASVLKINPYFIKDYQLAAKHYGKRKCMTIISLLRKYDMKCKGVDNATTPDGELLKELLYKILH